MVSPNLNKHLESQQPVEINENAKILFQTIYGEKNQTEESNDDTPRIKVSTLISRLAFFYEKIRNAVDYDEDHLLRKNAIARILRRQILIEGVVKEADSLKISEHLLIELIRGSYLPNNQIPETKIKEVAVMLEKYINLKNQISARINADLTLKVDIDKAKDLVNQKNNLIHWLLSLVACEIEENLAPNPVKQVIVNNLFDVLSKNIKLPADLPYEADLGIQIYLSISRNYLKFDEDMLSFVLFKYYNDDWLDFNLHEVLTADDLKKIKIIAQNFSELKSEINKQLHHPLTRQLDKIVRTYSLYASILVETVESDPAKVYNELQKGEKNFIALVRKVCAQKYHKAKKRLWRVALRSIIYIFLTKSIFVFIIEVPAIKFFNEPLNVMALAINVAFPAILLFIIVFLTRLPGENNTAKIVNGIKEMTFAGSERKQAIVLRRPTSRNWLKDGLYKIIYAAAFLTSIYYIILALTKINFNWVSITIFLFFLAFVSFFSVRTTVGIKELIVVERKENIITFLLDLFYMPIILAGRWLSSNFSKINIFIFFFDFIIETPFKVLMEIADDWTKYVRERRENIE
ncbi:MAG: hypothetical protein WC249_01990 [Patescibacteria group bacterium]|jgi:hypothetical protein